jgi:ankyrin repeat protein
LHKASYHGCLGIVKLLVESGADLYLRNARGETPIDVASANGKREVVKFLHENGAGAISYEDEDKPEDPPSQNLPSNIIPSLVRRERRVDALDNDEPSLHTVSRDGSLDIVLALLGHGVGVNERDANHATPLGLASTYGNLEVAKALIENGADSNLWDKYGCTPLHRASRHGYLDIVQLLLDNGAHVNAEEQKHWTPLHLASKDGCFEVVQVLLERGANVEAKNDHGRTAYDEALRRGESKIAGLLSQYGAQASIGDYCFTLLLLCLICEHIGYTDNPAADDFQSS